MTGLTIFLRSDVAVTILFAAHFVRPLSRASLQFERSVFFFGNPADIQRQDKVGVNETVTELTTARYCQWYAQLFNPAVSQGNDSYNTNSPSPSTSMVTVVRNYSHMCTCHIY